MAELRVALARAIPDPEPLSYYSMYAGMPLEQFEAAFAMPKDWRRRWCRATDHGSDSCHFDASFTGLGKRLGVPYEALQIGAGIKRNSAEIDFFNFTRTVRSHTDAWNEYRTTALKWTESEVELRFYSTSVPTTRFEVCRQRAWIDEQEYAAHVNTLCIEDPSGRRREDIQVQVTLSKR